MCPNNMIVGEFRGNHAHSVGRYGLRIFHDMLPRKFPCRGFSFDRSKLGTDEDPWGANPPLTASFYDMTSWKNGRNGAIAGRVADVRMINFKVADNLRANLEYSQTNVVGYDRAQIVDATVVGRSGNTDSVLEGATPWGIVGPRTERFLVNGANFYNFDFGGAAAFGTCSHCSHGETMDSGARTIDV